MYVTKYELLNHIHDENVPVVLVHFRREDDFVEFVKCLNWIWIKKLIYKHIISDGRQLGWLII